MITIGIDIGGTNIKTGIVDDSGRILAKSSVKTPLNPEKLAASIKAQTEALMRELHLSMRDIAGAGAGCPGMIDSHAGIVEYANNLRWDHVPLSSLIEKELNVPVHIANDANAAALGEFTFGAGKAYQSMILITLGTGVGGGIIIDGELFEGNGSRGAELGHMIIKCGGESCTCGRNGCLEAYASATALIRDTKRAMEKNLKSAMWAAAGSIDGVDGRTAFECAKKGDAAAAAVVDGYVTALGEGLCNFVNIFRPEALVLGGGVSAQGAYLLEPLDRFIKRYGYGGERAPAVKLLVAALGNDAGIIGAAALSRHRRASER